MSQTIKKESDKHIKDEVVVNAIKVMEKNAKKHVFSEKEIQQTNKQNKQTNKVL